MAPTCSNLGSPVVDVSLSGTFIKNMMINLGVSINVTTKETIIDLHLANINPIPTMVHYSTIKLEGIIEDLVIAIDSWGYPLDFLVLQLKLNLGGYPSILGRLWLATTDAFICCRSRIMMIYYGDVTNKLVLYPPAQPHSDLELSIGHTLEKEEKYPLQNLMTIERTPMMEIQDEDVVLTQTMQNSSGLDPYQEELLSCLTSPLHSLINEGDPSTAHMFYEVQSYYCCLNVSRLDITLVMIATTPIDVSLGKTLNINNELIVTQHARLL